MVGLFPAALAKTSSTPRVWRGTLCSSNNRASPLANSSRGGVGTNTTVSSRGSMGGGVRRIRFGDSFVPSVYPQRVFLVFSRCEPICAAIFRFASKITSFICAFSFVATCRYTDAKPPNGASTQTKPHPPLPISTTKPQPRPDYYDQGSYSQQPQQQQQSQQHPYFVISPPPTLLLSPLCAHHTKMIPAYTRPKPLSRTYTHGLTPSSFSPTHNPGPTITTRAPTHSSHKHSNSHSSSTPTLSPPLRPPTRGALTPRTTWRGCRG